MPRSAVALRRSVLGAVLLVVTAGCDLVTALGGGGGLDCFEDENCPPSMRCVDHTCQLAQAGADGSAVDRSADAQAPDSDSPEGRDAAPADRARPDQAAADRRDAASSDATIRDAAAGDAEPVEAALDAARPGDGGMGDAAAADQAAVPCGNGQIDVGEACDGQPGCSGGCQPLPGHVCSLDLSGAVICFDAFPVGAPSHLPISFARPQDLPEATLACSVAPISTSTATSNLNLCGVLFPVTVVTQTVGPELFVIFSRSLVIDSMLRFTGSRVPMLVVYGDLLVRGSIDVGASGATAGPGGDFSCGTSSGGDGAGSSSGGGGAGGGGNSSTGGKGGSIGTGVGAAGEILRAPAGMLLGGCRGGSGGYDSGVGPPRAAGGGGGGALQISASGSLSVTGALLADGAGGDSGEFVNSGGGGGGGSGGTLFLEAQFVDVEPSTVVIVGGGGGGGSSTTTTGTGGSPGRQGGSGGAGVGGYGAGGGGDRGEISAADGSSGSSSLDIGGGGGGGGFGVLVQVDIAP